MIGEFIPIKAKGLGDYRTTYFNIDDVDGVHNVTLVGKGSSGVLNFELELVRQRWRKRRDACLPASSQYVVLVSAIQH